MLDTIIKIHDQATQQAKEAMARSAKEHSRATGSAGYHLRLAVRTGMQREAPGGEAWPAGSPWLQFGSSLLGRARAAQRRQAKRKRAPKNPSPLYGTKNRTALKKLAGAVRYEKHVSGSPESGGTTLVRIGFLTFRVAELAAYHASGPHTIGVSPRMRRLIFAVGLGIRKSSITIPRRRHVEPVQEKNRSRITEFIRLRTLAALARENPDSVSPRFY